MQLQGMDTLESTTPTTSCFTTETRPVRYLHQKDGLRELGGAEKEKVEVEKGKSVGREDKICHYVICHRGKRFKSSKSDLVSQFKLVH